MDKDGALARATSIGPRAATRLEVSRMWLVAVASRDEAAIMIVYRLYGER